MKRMLAMIAALCLLLSACGMEQTRTGHTEETAGEARITFTDDMGVELSIAPPERVACLSAGLADVWTAAGGAGQIVATTNATWTYYDLPLAEDTVNLGVAGSLDLEALIASQPDLILASGGADHNQDTNETLREAGLTVATFTINDLSDYLRMLEIAAELTGCPENYDLYGEQVRQRADGAIARADGSRPTVLYIRATGSSCKVKNSEDSVLGRMLAELDCVNIADGDQTLLEELSMEAILQADPDYIFAVCHSSSDPAKAQKVLDETLFQNPAWNSLTAVEEGRFHLLTDPMFFNLKPNAQWGEAYEMLADILYPA